MKLHQNFLYSILLLSITFSPITYAADNIDTNTNDIYSNVDIIGQLKSKATGISRLRVGFYSALGYQGAINSDVSPEIQGFLIDAGAYTLINPIKKFADIEIGGSLKYNTGATLNNEHTGKTKYFNGLKQASVYAGPVFQFGEGKHAVGLGVSKAFYLGEVKGDKNDNTPKNDLSNGLGAYAEYQWVGKQGLESSRHTIPFARLTVERFDMKVSQTKETNKQTVIGLVVGAKY